MLWDDLFIKEKGHGLAALAFEVLRGHVVACDVCFQSCCINGIIS